jgi:hypothetical protein
VDENNDNLREHERKQDDIEALQPVHPAPQVSETPLKPVHLLDWDGLRALGAMYSSVAALMK